MKILNLSKKGNMFFSVTLLIVMVFIVSFVFIFVRTEVVSSEEIIGETQKNILNVYENGEKILFFLDKATEYSAHKAIYDLSSNGGFYEEPECGSYGGFVLWSNKGKDCFPSNVIIRTGLLSFINSHINKYVSSHNSDLSNNKESEPGMHPTGMVVIKRYDFIIKDLSEGPVTNRRLDEWVGKRKDCVQAYSGITGIYVEEGFGHLLLPSTGKRLSKLKLEEEDISKFLSQLSKNHVYAIGFGKDYSGSSPNPDKMDIRHVGFIRCKNGEWMFIAGSKTSRGVKPIREVPLISYAVNWLKNYNAEFPCVSISKSDVRMYIYDQSNLGQESGLEPQKTLPDYVPTEIPTKPALTDKYTLELVIPETIPKNNYDFVFGTVKEIYEYEDGKLKSVSEEDLEKMQVSGIAAIPIRLVGYKGTEGVLEYAIRPDTFTEVDYDLSVYDKIVEEVKKINEICRVKDVKKCVEEEIKKIGEKWSLCQNKDDGNIIDKQNDIDKERTFKICVEQDKKFFVYNEETKKVENLPIVIKFALNIQDNIPPPPIENLEAADVYFAEKYVILKWDKSIADDIEKYVIYYKPSNKKIGDVSTENYLNIKELSLEEIMKFDLYTLVDIDLNNREEKDGIANYEYVWYDKDNKKTYKTKSKVEKGKLYLLNKDIEHETDDQYLYALELDEDNINYAFAVTAVDYYGNENSTIKDSEIEKSIDDLPPARAQLVQVIYDVVNKKINLQWKKIDKNADGSPLKEEHLEEYRIYYEQADCKSIKPKIIKNIEAGILLGTASPSFTKETFDSPGFAENTCYYFAITAVDKFLNEYKKDLEWVSLEIPEPAS